MIVWRHDRVDTNILSYYRGQLDLPVKNGGSLTELDPSELDSNFSLVVSILISLIENDKLRIETRKNLLKSSSRNCADLISDQYALI